MNDYLKNKKAITLIALVITIVVLVILAVVTISLTVGNDGLIARAIKAAKSYKDAQERDKQSINDLYGELTIASDGTISGLTTEKLQEIINTSIEEKLESYATKEEVNNNGCPIGTIIAYYKSTAPTGYLACDGTTYDLTKEENSKYKALATFLGGGDNPTSLTVPDLRGEFLRGTGSNSHTQKLGVNNVSVREGDGAAVGTHQASTSIIPTYWSAGGHGGWYTNGSNTSFKHSYANADRTANDRTYYYESGSNGGVAQDGVASVLFRPTNTSVLYCIKY